MYEKVAYLENIYARNEAARTMKEWAIAVARLRALEDGEEVSDVEESDDEEDEINVQFSDDDEMEVEVDYPVPVGVDLNRVDWDGELLQALLSVDSTIPSPQGRRPESDRADWIAQEVGVKYVRSEMNALTQALEALKM
jgi:hypothetical protein